RLGRLRMRGRRPRPPAGLRAHRRAGDDGGVRVMNRRIRNAVAIVLPTMVVASLATAVTSPAAWAGGPSVTPPVVPAVPVDQQPMGGPRPADPATSNALHGNQQPSGAQADG